MSNFSFPRLFAFFLIPSIFFSCSDDSPAPEQTPDTPPKVEEKVEVSEKKDPLPPVYIEELDQFQEYFKEQHETSFSHVKKKNWMSYTAGKNGILTKILLFGKPNYTISEHYGSFMSGFVRADNPDTGPKLGQWSISREDIVNQLALQGLTETDRGWITLQMRGEIPQEDGRMYFIVCDSIGDNKAWFGAFAFAEANSYKKGRFWLHPEHDLVFRTYVGKTAEQIDSEVGGKSFSNALNASVVPENDLPESPKPMLELTRNFEPSLNPPPAPEDPQPILDKPSESLYQPATQAVQETPSISEPIQPIAPSPVLEPAPVENIQETQESKVVPVEPDSKDVPRRSLFDRFFEDKSKE